MSKRGPMKDSDAGSPLESAELGESGFGLLRVWLVSSSFRDLGHSTLLNGEAPAEAGDTVEITPDAKVWLSEDRAALVQLGVRVAPTVPSTFEMEATYAAQYVVSSASPVMSIEEFAWGNGLANLVPFIRMKLVQLTSESRFPTFYLQPLNLASLQASAIRADDAEG